MKQYPIEIKELADYLENSPSVFHVTAYTAALLDAAGFKALDMKEDWSLEKGGKYYCMPFSSTLFAFTIGENCDLKNPVHITGAHVDSPCLKIKPNPEITNHCYVQLNTEVYGGPILSTYFDRPLSLAGKVVLRGERYDQPISKLVDFKRPVIYIPNLAIHMNRSANEGAKIDKQRHLLPIIGTISDYLNKEIKFKDLLADEMGVAAADILDYDLCVYNPDKVSFVGFTGEFLAGPRLDDLTSVSAAVHGLIRGYNPDRINLCALVDNEETGSRSKQGADSSTAKVVMGKIWQAFGKTHVDCLSDITDGILLSLDVAHAYHPNYPAPQDITNFPIMNKGFILKTASNQSYVWDSEALATIIGLCQQEGIPYQQFVKESNTAGGGTIGSIITSRLTMKAVDMGVGLLAMHSMEEMMGKDDQVALARVIEAFYRL